MASSTPAAPAVGGALRVLDEAAATRAWNWILARQGLTDSRRLGTAWQVADAALGLHAARLPSPYAIVAARTSDPAIPASLFTSPVRASLLTLRCMRKTLHTLPLPLAAAAHSATLRFRDRDARRAVRQRRPCGSRDRPDDRPAVRAASRRPVTAPGHRSTPEHRAKPTSTPGGWRSRSRGNAGRSLTSTRPLLEPRGPDLRPHVRRLPHPERVPHPRTGRHRTGHRLLRPVRARDDTRRHLVVRPVRDRHHRSAAGIAATSSRSPRPGATTRA